MQPDARPVAVGETDLRAILRNLTDSATAAAAEVLVPEQLAVGVSGGISRGRVQLETCCSIAVQMAL